MEQQHHVVIVIKEILSMFCSCFCSTYCPTVIVVYCDTDILLLSVHDVNKCWESLTISGFLPSPIPIGLWPIGIPLYVFTGDWIDCTLPNSSHSKYLSQQLHLH